MTTNEVLDDIIAKLAPEEVPPEYIVMAKITDFQGVEHIFQGDELVHVLKYPELYQIADARVVLNVRKIKGDILHEVNAIYRSVFNEKHQRRLPPAQ